MWTKSVSKLYQLKQFTYSIRWMLVWITKWQNLWTLSFLYTQYQNTPSKCKTTCIIYSCTFHFISFIFNPCGNLFSFSISRMFISTSKASSLLYSFLSLLSIFHFLFYICRINDRCIYIHPRKSHTSISVNI